MTTIYPQVLEAKRIRHLINVPDVPIHFTRPTLELTFGPDRYNNVGRWVTIPRSTADRYDEPMDGWQIVGAHQDEDGNERYSIVHISDPSSYGMSIALRDCVTIN